MTGLYGFLSTLFSGGIDTSDLPPSEVGSIIASEIKSLESLEPEIKAAMIHREMAAPSPLYAQVRLSNGSYRCFIYLNTNDEAWSNWGLFLNKSNKLIWPDLVRFSVVHELGHCVSKANNQNFVTKNIIQGGRSILMSKSAETYSDVYGLLYLASVDSKSKARKIALEILPNRSGQKGGYSEAHDSSKAVEYLLNSELLSDDPKKLDLNHDGLKEISSKITSYFNKVN